MARTLSLTGNTLVEIISAYSTSTQQLPASSADDWAVIGAFYMPQDVEIRLELIGLVSTAGPVLYARLYDVAAAAIVSGSVTDGISALIDSRALSGAFALSGGKVYQVQAKVAGASGFGVARTVSPIQS